MAGEGGWILVTFKVKLTKHPLFLLAQHSPVAQDLLIHEISISHATTDHSR